MPGRISAGGLLAAWQNRRRYRRTIEELSTLTERELKDIGLSRDDASPFHPWKFPHR